MKDLIEKLRNDTLSPEELRELKGFFSEASEEEIEALFPIPGEEAGQCEVPDELVSRMKRRIDEATEADRPEVDLSRFRLYRRVLFVAAGLIPLLIVGLILSWILPSGVRENESYVISTGKGESSNVTLPEGSLVALNQASILSVDNFSKKRRGVMFEGEAYFEVSADEKHPFTIMTPVMEVKVYGTSFNVVSRPGYEFSEVSLDEGKVVLKSNKSQEEVTLSKGQRALLDVRTGNFTISQLTSISSSWKSKELLFYHDSPEYVIERFECAYDTVLDKGIKSRMRTDFTGMLPTDNYGEAISILESVYSTK